MPILLFQTLLDLKVSLDRLESFLALFSSRVLITAHEILYLEKSEYQNRNLISSPFYKCDCFMGWMIEFLHYVCGYYRGTPANPSNTMDEDISISPGFFDKFKGELKVLADIEIVFVFSG